MRYAPWINDYDKDYARISVDIPDIPQIKSITGDIRFGHSLKECWPDEEVVLKLEPDSGI